MKGDKLIIQDCHVEAARQILELIQRQIATSEGPFILTVGGESGSGKSEIAAALAQLLTGRGIASTTLQQDDYFVYPPKTNAAMRRKSLDHVGLRELRLELLDQHLEQIRRGGRALVKPVVHFEEDRIGEERLSIEGSQVVIVEGTYTSLLENVDRRVFLERTYEDTRAFRRERGREEQDSFLGKVLEIEHRLIAPHRQRADILVSREYEVRQDGQDRE